MTLEPSVIVLYVDDLPKASQFYQDLLGTTLVEASITFHSFILSNGMHLALKAKHSVVPPVEDKSGNGELAFTLDCNNKVDELFKEWQDKKIAIISPPTQLPFGYTFVALDPDGNRLRIASLGNHSQLSNDKLSRSPIVKCIDSFIVTGFSVRTQNKDEFNEKTSKLSKLWQQFSTSELATNANIFGVYSNYDSDANGFYTVTAGVKGDHAKTELSEVTVQAGNYLVFEATGPMPGTVVETWKRVWEFFETNTEYSRNFISDFEKYSSTDHVEIYIGLK